MLKVGVLVSGGGTNLQAILDAIDSGKITNAKVEVVISNNPGAYALERARNHGIEAVCISPKSFENRTAFNEAFLKKLEANRTELNIKVKNFDREAAEFRNKVENGGFMTRERAEQAQMDLMIKQQNLQKLQQEMTENAQREQMEINRKLYDAITNFLTEYNKAKGFQLILSTTLGGNVLFAQEGFDITNDVVNQLNEQYKKK